MIPVLNLPFLDSLITQHVYNYTKSPIIRPLVERLLGKGVVWAEGEEHKAQRQMLTPAFRYVTEFNYILMLTGYLESQCGNGERDGG